jgi:hypothetical protein
MSETHLRGDKLRRRATHDMMSETNFMLYYQ